MANVVRIFQGYSGRRTENIRRNNEHIYYCMFMWKTVNASETTVVRNTQIRRGQTRINLIGQTNLIPM